jgi:hypothetical protein
MVLGLVCPVAAMAYSSNIVVTSLSPVRGKTQKHFDANKDKVLNMRERALYNTYLRFRFPLAKGKRMKFFDKDQTYMLEHGEYRQYLTDKKQRFKSYRAAVAQSRSRIKYYKNTQGRRL